jgi:hypothetical protein
MRAGGSNIYMYMKGKYTKNPLKEYNNTEANIYLTGATGPFYELPIFPLLRTRQGSTSTGLCYVSPTV